jgi:hypothetical protein
VRQHFPAPDAAASEAAVGDASWMCPA